MSGSFSTLNDLGLMTKIGLFRFSTLNKRVFKALCLFGWSLSTNWHRNIFYMVVHITDMQPNPLVFLVLQVRHTWKHPTNWPQPENLEKTIGSCAKLLSNASPCRVSAGPMYI